MPSPIYLILAGSNRSGTTAFFEYLTAHEEIARPSIKQTLYFLDKEYSGVTAEAARHFDDSPEEYYLFFPGRTDEKYCLEASPDYMYSLGTIDRIKQFSEKASVRIIFLLRDPVDRFVSWFYHAKQVGELDNDITLNDFIKDTDLDTANDEGDKNTATSVLQTGQYSHYIEPYLKKFGSDVVSIMFFEDMVNEPQTFMRAVCLKYGVNPDIYIDYSFEQHNASMRANSALLHKLFRLIRKTVLLATKKNTFFRKLLEGPRQKLSKTLKSVTYRAKDNTDEGDSCSDDLMSIKQFYQTEYQRLTALTKSTVPWTRYQNPEGE